MTAFEDAHGGEEADTGAKAGAADLELAGEFALGGESVAGFDFAGGDEGAYVLDDLHGELAVAGDFVVHLFTGIFVDFFFQALALLAFVWRSWNRGSWCVKPSSE